MHDFKILVQNILGEISLCNYYTGTPHPRRPKPAKGERLKVDMECEPVVGRHVLITIPGKNERLTMCEVEIYGKGEGSLGIYGL